MQIQGTLTYGRQVMLYLLAVMLGLVLAILKSKCKCKCRGTQSQFAKQFILFVTSLSLSYTQRGALGPVRDHKTAQKNHPKLQNLNKL